ncbi:MAG: diguanylate cyclase, partial [Arcobacter sp.]|nr:diguanylate cyclase [Arcobacter sp.]
MNTRIFLKIAWLFILGLLSYLFFVVFFLSPKINNFLTNTEINNSKTQFDRMVWVINEKSRSIENKENFEKEIQLLLSGVILGKSGYAFIFDSKGKIIFDPSGEFTSKEFDKSLIPGVEKKYLFEELKKAYNEKRVFEYNWNRVYDPHNYSYEKLSWIDYNEKLDWYIVSNIYKDDFTSFVAGTNSLILNISMVLFGVLSIIAIIISVKVIAPINKMFKEVQKANVTTEFENGVKEKDEIGFLATQFNTLLDQVENNRKNFEEQVQVKTKEIQDRLYYDDLTNLKNRTALEDDIKDNDFVSIALIDVDAFGDINELYGFSTGNLVLIEVAKILNEFATKFSVTPYRIYGNVFCLADKKMMGFTKYDEFISELCTIFKNRPIRIEELDIDVFINVTLGISIAQDEPIKAATIALKKAKKANMKFFVYNNEIDTKEIIKKSMYWREKLKTAIEEDAVVPFYQPIFNRNNEIVKYETLMRIKDVNENGETVYLSPFLFLDISVKTKQYLQLSNQIISKAFLDLSKTKRQIT